MQADLIYDVGMNNGDDTAYYLHIGFRVVAIEADPDMISSAQMRFANEIAEGRLRLVHAAIGAVDGMATFWICDDKREWNSFDKAIASRMGKAHHSIQVPCRRFASLMKEHGTPYYLKIDIEGHDHYCASDIDPADSPKYVSLELDRLEDLVLLHQKGYNSFKIITQNDFSQMKAEPIGLKQALKLKLEQAPMLYKGVDALTSMKGKLVRLLRLGKAGQAVEHNGWQFPEGSSGPFGEETAGQWQSLDEAAYAWLHYKLGRSEHGRASLSVWHDVHATRA